MNDNADLDLDVSDMAFALLNVAFQSVSATLLHINPDSGREILNGLQQEIDVLVGKAAIDYPHLADGVIEVAADRVRAALNAAEVKGSGAK